MAALASTLLRATTRTTVIAIAGLSLSLIVRVQASDSSIAQVLLAQQRAAKAGPDAMRRCMATWDRSAQMSKQEWKETCRRVIKDNPGLYGKPF